MVQGKAGAPAKRRRRRLAVLLAVLVVGAVAGVLHWQERSMPDRVSGASPTWRAGQPTSSGVAPTSVAPVPAAVGPRFDIAREQLKALAHKLKGGAVSVCAQRITDLAAALEHTAPVEPFSELTGVVDQIQATLDECASVVEVRFP